MSSTRRPLGGRQRTERRLSRFLASLLTGGLLLGMGSSLPLLAAVPAVADETTISGDTLRTGWDSNEPGLAPAQVSSSDFGQQFSTTVDGQVYAQPLVIGKTVVAATEKAKVYGLDSASGKINWTADLGAPW